MGRPARGAHAVETPERVLRAAEAEFSKRGYAAARLEDIASAAGIGRSSLLYHFDSKRTLYEATVARAFTRLGAVLRQAMEGEAPFPARLETVTRSFAAFLEANPSFARLVLRELAGARGPGWDILRSQVSPVLDGVEAFLEAEGRGHLRPGLPARAALMQVVSDILLRSAAAELRESLWGAEDAWTLARWTFFGVA